MRHPSATRVYFEDNRRILEIANIFGNYSLNRKIVTENIAIRESNKLFQFFYGTYKCKYILFCLLL
jgi:hypothetical protein